MARQATPHGPGPTLLFRWLTRVSPPIGCSPRSKAFKNYDESGSAKKVTCLKYLVLANMLMKSNVDPFDAQEVSGQGRGEAK